MVEALVHQSTFFFRLSSDVGNGKANRPDDVEFVRFGIACCRAWMLGLGMAGNPRYADFLDASEGVSKFGGMDYRIDPCIRTFQKSQQIQVDGVVSSVSQILSPSGKPYTYAYMNKAMQRLHPNIYPRIDVLPETGLLITWAVKSLFADKSPTDKPVVS